VHTSATIEAKLDEIDRKLRKLRGTLNSTDLRTEKAQNIRRKLDELYGYQAALFYALGKRTLDIDQF
jgi:hypothetical protein